MKFVAIHDSKGNIAAFIGCPAGAPAAAVAAKAGELVTEVEVPKGTIDPADPQSFQRLVDVIDRYRVEVKTEARLSRESRPKAR